MSTGPAGQDDLCRMMSVCRDGGWGRHAEDEVTHTRFSSHSSRNCWNFWDISSWALPTALRIFPRTAGKKHTGAHASARTSTHAGYDYSHTAAYRRRVAALNRRRCLCNAKEKDPSLISPRRDRINLGKSNNYRNLSFQMQICGIKI